MMKLFSALSLIMALCLISANVQAQDEPGGRPGRGGGRGGPGGGGPGGGGPGGGGPGGGFGRGMMGNGYGARWRDGADWSPAHGRSS